MEGLTVVVLAHKNLREVKFSEAMVVRLVYLLEA